MSCRKMPISSRSRSSSRIKRQHPIGDVEQLDDVLQQAAEVGVVIADAGRHLAEIGDEFLVHEEALDQGAQVRIAHLEQSAAQPLAAAC